MSSFTEERDAKKKQKASKHQPWRFQGIAPKKKIIPEEARRQLRDSESIETPSMLDMLESGVDSHMAKIDKMHKKLEEW
jgi:hypothetical protein